MRHLFIICILGLFFASCNQGNSVSSENEKQEVVAEAVNIKTVQIDVSGMTCEGCEKTVESALANVEGVYTCQASHSKAIAIVSYDSTLVDQKVLWETINNTGYKVENITTNELH